MATATRILEVGWSSVSQLFLLVPLSILGGIIVGYIQPWGLRLFVVGVGWFCLRLSISRSLRIATEQSFHVVPEKGIRIILGCILVVAPVWTVGAPAWILWRYGWQNTWGWVRETYGAVLVGLFAAVLTTVVTIGLVILIIRLGVACLQAWWTTSGLSKVRDVCGVLGVISGEVILGGWFILALYGPVTMRLSPLQWGAVIGFLAPLFAWWEGDQRESSSSYARLLMCVLTILVHYEVVVTAHDWLISGPMVHLPLSFRVVLPVATLLTFGMVFFVLLSLNWIWQRAILRPRLNTMALAWLKQYLTRDSCGKWYTLIRHLGHVFAHRKAPTRWLWEGFCVLWQLFLGKFPACFIPVPVHPSRYEQYIRAQLDERKSIAQQCARTWRAAYVQDPAHTTSEAQALRAAAQQQAELLLALGHYVVCPHQPCVPRVLPTTMWELAEEGDRLLLAVRALLVEANRNGNDLLDAVRQHVLGYYQWFQQQSGNSWFRELIPFRLRIVSGHESDDLSRLVWRDHVVHWAQIHPNESHFAVHVLLAEYRRAQDWASLIEACRLLTTSTPYVLTEADHLDVGEAYAGYATELGSDVLGQWAWEQAMKHVYEAKAAEHLRSLSALLEEARL